MSHETSTAVDSRSAKSSVPPGPRAWVKTPKRVLTRRGVLWLGQTCNLRCYFCYFLNRIADAQHPEHPFMSLDKAKDICKTLREFYGNTAVDIQGGEPTIYPDILALCAYCREIGLIPTLITNGLRLARPGVLEAYRDAGLRDFLVSLHGIKEIHDEVVGVTGAYEDIIASIERMRDLGIPFRFNCTMSKPVIPLLPDIARKAVEFGAYVVNYIAFNPYEDQETGVRTGERVPRYSEIRPKLAEAMDILEEAGIEVNVRYVPLCMAEERHRKNFYNFQQLPYDTHEWDYQSWLWSGLQPQRMRDGALTPTFRLGPYARWIFRKHMGVRRHYGRHPALGLAAMTAQRLAGRVAQVVVGKERLYREEAIIRARDDAGHRHHEVCQRCSLKGICDGFHGDYADFFGTKEACPITDVPPTEDSLYYARRQEKVVEPEDQAWVLDSSHGGAFGIGFQHGRRGGLVR